MLFNITGRTPSNLQKEIKQSNLQGPLNYKADVGKHTVILLLYNINSDMRSVIYFRRKSHIGRMFHVSKLSLFGRQISTTSSFHNFSQSHLHYKGI